MCAICMDFSLGKMTIKEAHAAMLELMTTGGMDPDHATDIWDLITAALDEEIEDAII